MHETNPFIKTISLLVIVSLLQSCFPQVYKPERFASIEEAFTDEDEPARSDIPPKSCKVAIFDAPFDDVYRAASVAVSKKNIYMNSADKNKGLIKGSKVSNASRKYYKLVMRKVSTLKTELAVLSKGQSSCSYVEPWAMALNVILSLGILLIAVPMESRLMSKCDEQSSLHWEEDESTLSDIITETRNNLIAAGAI